VAAGALVEGRGGLTIGTTSVLLDALAEKAVDLDHELLTMPSPFDDTYLLWAENGLGGRVLEHVLVDVVHAVDALGDHQTDDEYARLDAALASVPAGSEGVLFLPWLNGSLSPDTDPNVRGGFVNLSLRTGRAHLVRAVAEGVAHNLRWLLPFAEAFTGRPMDEIAFLGGAARSSEWCQILADVLDRPILPLDEPSWAVARGVASLAQHRHGVIDRSALADRIEVADRYEPDPTRRDRYEAMHEQFEAAFTALRPICEALNG
jgi:xylulokinase